MTSTKDRWSRVSVPGMLRLSGSNLLLFQVASAMGRQRGERSGYASLGGGEKVVGTEINAKRRDAVLDEVGRTLKTWQNALAQWERLRMAHRCTRGNVFLFASPIDGSGALCPNCGQGLPDMRERKLPTSRKTVPDIRERRASSQTVRTAETAEQDGSATRSGVRGLSVKEEQSRGTRGVVDHQHQGHRPASKKIASLDELETAALLGDWDAVDELAQQRGWSIVADLARRAQRDPIAADRVRQKLELSLETTWWTMWWGSLSEGRRVA